MLIGIISDTHDRIPGMIKALEIFKKRRVGLVLHCGDWITPNSVAFFVQHCQALGLPLKGVWGNNDTVAETVSNQQNIFLGTKSDIVSDVLKLNIDARHIAVCHGHKKELLQNTIESGEFDAVFTGHSHRVKVIKFGETLVANPGSAAFEMPFTKQNIATVGIYNTKDNTVEIIELD